MWIFSKYGFYSVSCANKVIGGKVTDGLDLESAMVRSRWKAHLVRLRDRFPELPEIISTKGTDYKHRIICSKELWSKCLYEISMEQDYLNFKHICTTVFGEANSYSKCLLDIWITVRKAVINN